MRKIVSAFALAAALVAGGAGAGYGIAQAGTARPAVLCEGRPGSIPYAYCALKVTYPRNAVICGTRIPTASHCEIFADGARLGRDYGRGSYLVYGP